MITSAQNPKLKLTLALGGRPRERRRENAFLAEGVQLVEEALAANWPFRFVLFSDSLSERGQILVDKLKVADFEVEEVTPNLLQSISETETSQGILAVLNNSPLPIPDSRTFLLILDQIRDPGNLGSLLRTAAAVGVQAVLLPPETTDAFAPKVIRAGMGAHFRLPIHIMDWREIKQVCKSANLHVFLADTDGSPCWEIDFQNPLVLIIGGEAQGASGPARTLANTTVSIPMPGEADSLNASIAGAVLVFEVLRQRKL